MIKIADELQPFGNDEQRSWQVRVKTSNAEAEILLASARAHGQLTDLTRTFRAVGIAVRVCERGPLLCKLTYGHVAPVFFEQRMIEIT